MPLLDPWLPDPDPQTKLIPAHRGPVPQKVYRIWRDVLDEWDYEHPEPLPNVWVSSVEEQLGAVPGHARLVYRLATGDPNDPQGWEQCLSDKGDAPRAIQPDDRILITATRPDGVEEPYFEGFAIGFQGAVQAGKEAVAVDVVNVAIRLWDAPIQSVSWRTSLDAQGAANADVEADAHFNARGANNCMPGGPQGLGWVVPPGGGDRSYPTFVDPDNAAYVAAIGPTVQWDLARAARYLLFRHNDEQYVTSPDGADLDDVLVARVPIDGTPYDPADPSSYTPEEIAAPDKPILGKGFVDVLADLIQGKGYDIRLETGPASGTPDALRPETTLDVILPQREVASPLWLQPRGSTLDLSLTEISGFAIGRDLSQVANEWLVEGELEEWEVSIILAAGFPTAAADAESPSAFDRGNEAFEGVRNQYRLFVADEAGEGHYQPGGSAKATSSLDLDAIFGAPQVVDGVTVPQYARRRRKPWPQLLQKDPAGNPARARLDISFDFSAKDPKTPRVWDGSAPGAGHWQPVLGGWECLTDRIGIWINAQNPNAWHIGRSNDPGAPYKEGVVKLVEAMAAPNAWNKLPFLRLTMPIRADRRVRGLATRKFGAVINEPVRRVIDAHDRLFKRTIAANSVNNATADPYVVRDDSDLAQAEATATQLITQNGQLVAEPVVIPRFTRFHRLGTRISQIQGRGVGFKTNAAARDAPTYPVVVGIRHDFEGDRQTTTLRLSDADAGRHSYLSRINHRGGGHDPRR